MPNSISMGSLARRRGDATDLRPELQQVPFSTPSTAWGRPFGLEPALDHLSEFVRVVEIFLVAELPAAGVVELGPVRFGVGAAVAGVVHHVADRADDPAPVLVDHVPLDRERPHLVVDRLGHGVVDPLEDRGSALHPAVVVLVVVGVLGEALGPLGPVAALGAARRRLLEVAERVLDLRSAVAHGSPSVASPGSYEPTYSARSWQYDGW